MTRSDHPDAMTKCPECTARFVRPVVGEVPDRPDLRSFACPACCYIYAHWPARELGDTPGDQP